MSVRWTPSTLLATEKHYKKVMSYRDLWQLKAHLDELDVKHSHFSFCQFRNSLHTVLIVGSFPDTIEALGCRVLFLYEYAFDTVTLLIEDQHTSRLLLRFFADLSNVHKYRM
jgi:hypothetical protein